MKCKLVIRFLIVLISLNSFSQKPLEREHRIRKSQFPDFDMGLVTTETKKIRYYREIDTAGINYILKFKKDRLNYQIKMDETAQIEHLGFGVKEIDIPEATWANMMQYFKTSFKKVKVKRIIQIYPVSDSEPLEKTIKNTFQNLMLPNNLYVFTIAGKKEKRRQLYELTFDSEGLFRSIKNVLPANHDHVLY